MAIKIYAKDEATKISQNFKSTEFDCHGEGCCSSTLVDSKLVDYLQDIRDHFGKPLNVSSAYRCDKHNKRVGGATGSRHKKGEAADIYINGIEPKEIAKYAESIGILGIGLYETDKDGYFVHIDTRSTKSFWYGQAQEKRDTFGGQQIKEEAKVEEPVKIDTSKVNTNAIDPKVMWDYFKSQGLNDYGVAGLMGNLYAESALRPCNLQSTFEKKLGMTDAEYTASVDAGVYTNFIKDGAGYGLAQWTYWSLKQELLEYVQAKKKSIGDGQIQMEFLAHQLSKSFAKVWSTLKTANSILEASNAVLMQFERPADQSEAVQKKRAAYGQEYFNKFTKKEPALKISKFKINDTVKLLESATYVSGTPIPQWIKNSLLYVIDITENGDIIFSTQKSGPSVGLVKEEYLIKTEAPKLDPKELAIGDIVYLTPEAKFSNGQSIQSWVFKSKLYVRQIRENGDVIISTKPIGEITGVVNKKYLTKDFTPPEVKAQVTASSLRLREGPGTNYKAVGYLPKYTTVVIKEVKNGWGKTEQGWISLEYTKKV